jgi:dienelactone hydrolase
MHFLNEATLDGVTERSFVLDNVPGILWTPAGDHERRPLVLLGHGGGQHKKAPAMTGRARRMTALGFAAVALDAPGHGDRRDPSADVTGLRRPTPDEFAQANADRAKSAVPEWRATLDALRDHGHGLEKIGFVGVAMGASIGIPLAAEEPRITAAVFGLAPPHPSLTEAAKRITIPIKYLMQWDDELIPRESSLALFDAFASTEKTLHANPGSHAAVPSHERDSDDHFLQRHLA